MGELDKNHNLTSSFLLIKFGYTSNWSKRLQVYKNKYYSVRSVALDFGEKVDKKVICEFLQDYKTDKDGWYSFNPYIVEWFKQLTPDQLKDLRDRFIEEKSKPIKAYFKKKVNNTNILLGIIDRIAEEEDRQFYAEKIIESNQCNCDNYIKFTQDSPIEATFDKQALQKEFDLANKELYEKYKFKIPQTFIETECYI